MSTSPNVASGRKLYTERFPQHATEKTLEQFLTLNLSKGMPQVFSQFCSSAVKWQSVADVEITATSSVADGKCYIIEASRDSFVRGSIPRFGGANLVLCHFEDVRAIKRIPA